MIRTLLVSLALISSTAFAADPVTERPGNPGYSVSATPNRSPNQPPAIHTQPGNQNVAPRPAERAIKVPGSVWEGTEQINNNGKLTLGLHSTGVALMADAHGESRGRWTTDGVNVVITFDNCVYRGVVQGNDLVGQGTVTSGSQTGQTWSFRVGHVNPYAGREYNGNEQLNSNGKLTFRFAADGSVLMIDANSQVRGTYTYDVGNITCRFENCEYVGAVQNDQSIRGTARVTTGQNTIQPWTYSVSPRK